MPVIVWGLGTLAVGTGVKLFGGGVKDSTTGASRLLIAGAGVGVVYLIAKKKKVI